MFRNLLLSVIKQNALERIIRKALYPEYPDSVFNSKAIAKFGSFILNIDIDSKTKEIVNRLSSCKRDSSESDAYIKEYKKLICVFAEMPASKFGFNKWQVLSLYFISKGMYSLGCICREKSKECIIGNKKITYMQILVLIENSMLTDAKERLEIFKNSFKGKFITKEIALIEAFVDLLQNTTEDLSYDNEFCKYVKGKSILIIGPTVGNNNLENIPFINEATCIVRNNVMPSKTPDNLTIHVSYYNREGFQKLINNEGIEACEKAFDWLVTKSVEKAIGEKRDKIHVAPSVTNLLYMGTANMLPRMIVDLKLHGAYKIYVCGNNLFLSKNSHSKDYAIQPKLKAKNFTIHNLCSQHSILKLMYNHGMFIADTELSRVLNFSTIEYAEKMEKIYTY